MEPYATEIIISLFLFGFAWAFRNWATTIKESTKDIIAMLRSLSKEFHQHTLITENRVTRVEEKVEGLEKRGNTP